MNTEMGKQAGTIWDYILEKNLELEGLFILYDRHIPGCRKEILHFTF